MRKKFAKFTIIAVFAMLGGAVSNMILVASAPVLAEGLKKSSYLLLFDDYNKKGIEAYVYNGYPAQNFYAKDGKIRLQQGLYNAPGEDGLPMIAMSDNNGDLKMLLRLAGKNESPVIIMKDNQHRDRLVFGLDLNSPAQDPFMAAIDASGRKNLVFGNY
ncbi:MAG: hypothetical protein KDI13_01095 [Alphaproteobacteria bacterium]|nr:hypothetical protein [Alphaproteobacteria bacterium]